MMGMSTTEAEVRDLISRIDREQQHIRTFIDAGAGDRELYFRLSRGLRVEIAEMHWSLPVVVGGRVFIEYWAGRLKQINPAP
ncbi:MAG: hypothetical protein QOG91_423 [Candidatus Parcubacteria bacterium]|jgi:hypothetical protein|nr:hypothetical protein [Candidatus Parcubacteria bacterium]